MGNLYFELANQSFCLNTYNRMNKKRRAQHRIKFIGEFDEFTVHTLYEHYDLIANNLKVYPKVIVYDYTHRLEGGFSGLYSSSNHTVEITDQYYIISTLAHEMRHAFQAVYFPMEYQLSEYRNAREYLACDVEIDAREYEYDYCEAQGLYEEKQALLDGERQIQAVIKGVLPPSAAGLSDEYIRNHPRVNTYEEAEQLNEEYAYDEDGNVVYVETNEKRFSNGIINFFKGIAVIVFFIGLFTGFFSDDKDDKGKQAVLAPIEESHYILENSANIYITDEQLLHLNLQQLGLARNEIYARHGFIFGSEDLQEYFMSKPWYTPNPEYSDDLLSQIEHANIAQILQFEKQIK